MIRNSIDVATRVTPRLSMLIEKVANNPDAEEQPTLSTVRDYFMGLLPGAYNETERLHHFDLGDSLLDELDTLIEEYGDDAPAADFVRASASENLTRAIEAVVNDENRENPPTLLALRDAVAGGLGARLVGEGALEDDEDDLLLAEVDSLIEHFGEDALAEDFLRYE